MLTSEVGSGQHPRSFDVASSEIAKAGAIRREQYRSTKDPRLFFSFPFFFFVAGRRSFCEAEIKAVARLHGAMPSGGIGPRILSCLSRMAGADQRWEM